MSNNKRGLTRRELADAFRVDVRTVSKWQEQGLPVDVKGAPGKPALFSLADAVEWRIARELESRGADPDTLSHQEELARLNRKRREEIELRLQVRRGELIPLDDVVREFADCASAVKAKLRRIPDAVADKLVTAARRGPAVVKAMLLVEIDEALRELAKEGEDDPTPDDEPLSCEG